MQRPIILIYVIVTSIVAIVTAVLEVQPALFFIKLSAPNPGDAYQIAFVIAATALMLLLPFMLLLLCIKVLRKKPTEIIDAHRTGVFVTREKAFQSAIVGIPVYINSQKVGQVDNGKTKFFDIPIGEFNVLVGKRKQASTQLEAKVSEKDQLHFKFTLLVDGLFTEIELVQI